MEELIEAVKLTGSVAGAITATCACVLFFVKPIRIWMIKKIQGASHSSELEKVMKETQTALAELKKLLEEHIIADEKWKKEVSGNFKEQTETDIVQLRNTINHIYDKNYEVKSLTMRDKESLIDLFDRYKAIGGNHNVEQKYNEMLSWIIRK